MPVVVKLGGSLAAAGTLKSWLEVVMEEGPGRCVVVPGGGDFADAVRAAQRRYRLSDGAAHRMALLAMEQYALLVNDVASKLRLCPSEEAIATTLAAGGIPLWLPNAMAGADPTIRESWDITSDSLAAWLARRLNAAALVLVKSAPVSCPPPPPAELAELGIVDRAFPDYVADAEFAIVYCSPGEEARLAAVIGLG